MTKGTFKKVPFDKHIEIEPFFDTIPILFRIEGR